MNVSSLDRWLKLAAICCIVSFALVAAGSFAADIASGAAKEVAGTIQTLAAIFMIVSLVAEIVMWQVENHRQRRRQ